MTSSREEIAEINSDILSRFFSTLEDSKIPGYLSPKGEIPLEVSQAELFDDSGLKPPPIYC